MNKLDTLMESEGFDDIIAFLDAFVTDSVAPAIGMNDGCDYTCEMEQDQDAGHTVRLEDRQIRAKSRVLKNLE